MVQYLKGWFKKPDEQPVPEKDPIVHSSLATPLAIFSLLMMLSLVWAFYDEMIGLRPWRAYQNRFAELYEKALAEIRPVQASEVASIKESAGYQELQQRLLAAEADIKSQLGELEKEEDEIRAKLDVVTAPFTTARSELQAQIYALETASEGAKEKIRLQVEELKQEPHELEMPDGPKTLTFDELEKLFDKLKDRQGEIQSEKAHLLRGPSELRGDLDRYLKNHLSGLTPTQIDGLMHGVENQDVEIKQIHNPEMQLVDRCESCHMGIREPVDLTADQMGGNQLFVSHPRRELLTVHDPEVFGCSPCHNGNGVGTVSATKAHGLYKHWLWPLYAPENFEAGCHQCHRKDRQLEGASALNAAKDRFDRGCRGCHPYDGFDPEPARMREVRKDLADLSDKKQTAQVLIERLLAEGDRAESNEAATAFYDQAEKQTLKVADLDSEMDRLNRRLDELLMERKRVGPNLKDVRNKLYRDWIPAWLKDVQAFRPDTKMPQFRLDEDEIEAISAFIWQSGLEEGIQKQPPGDPEHGRQLFESRGCLACHSVGEGEEAMGGTFAANLSRVGEKARYDYLVRWVHNPRQRTLPYDPVLKRDVTREDYESRGLPFQFDLENNKSPLGDHTLQVQNPTVMPSLRLDWDEARDVASYLVTLKREDATYESAPYMEDQQLVDRGRFLVRHYGCAGCHEIAGLEEDMRIGTDLTSEGSKPIERLDFALLTHDAKKEGWYTHKGFFEHKLKNPAVFDEGKIKDELEELRMPNFHLSEEEIDHLTTFLLGSVDSRIPEKFFYAPGDLRQDVQKGWWVVKKYNCMACHQITPGQETVMEELPQYQGEGAEKLPPVLVGQGARTNPEWLKKFLSNPALSSTDLHRNGVRPYLDVRMPTFYLSAGEIGILVRFFQALARQPLPYLPVHLQPLSPKEKSLARDLFTSQAAPCLRCHATGDPRTDQSKTAPNFALVSQRLKPDWVKRWIVHPEVIRPGTAMPSGLFRWDGKRWVFALASLPSFSDYEGDHAELVVRYMFEYTAEEQRRLTGR